MVEDPTSRVSHANEGKVYLVGAGPGDPGLITLRGVQCLQQADVVLYDYLVNPVIAQHAPPTAELICLGRHGHSRIWRQPEINRQLVELAQEGKTVVRLKGGDPAVFARGGEEAAFLKSHGIPLEIVPGITAALAAGSHAGIPVTHRDVASAVALITGREDVEKTESGLDYDALARFPGTLVFYMGVTTAKTWTAKLIEHGLSADTPAALVRRCSRNDQQTLRCTLGEIAERLTPYSRFPPPVIAIVGAVAGVESNCEWFENRPLFGQTIMVTRPQHQAAELGRLLSQQGAQVIYQPAIQIAAPASWQRLDTALDALPETDWLVFSSVNGVKHFFERLHTLGRDARVLGSTRLAAIGPATTAALQERGLIVDLQPEEFRAEALAAALVAAGVADKRCLLIRASRGREVLAEELVRAGAIVTQAVAYDSTDVVEPLASTVESIQSGGIDWVTVTSSAIARSLYQMLGADAMASLKLVSISPVTTATLAELKLKPALEASEYTTQGVVDRLCDFYR